MFPNLTEKGVEVPKDRALQQNKRVLPGAPLGHPVSSTHLTHHTPPIHRARTWPWSPPPLSSLVNVSMLKECGGPSQAASRAEGLPPSHKRVPLWLPN